MVARLTPDQEAACSNHVGVSLQFFAFILKTVSIEKTVKAVLKGVEIMKQRVKVNEMCCCVETDSVISYCMFQLSQYSLMKLRGRWLEEVRCEEQ